MRLTASLNSTGAMEANLPTNQAKVIVARALKVMEVMFIYMGHCQGQCDVKINK